MKNLHLACLGGCINKQPGLEPEAHYHAVLSQKLAIKEPPLAVTVAIGSYLSIDRLVERAGQLLHAERPDFLCVYVRPFLMMPLHKLLVRHETRDKRLAWAWHPALFRRKMAWHPRLSQFQTDWPFVFLRRNRFGWRDWNLLAGLLLGLHAWARQYMLQQLDLLTVCCGNHGARLIVMAPAQNPDSMMGDYLCEQAFQAIRRYCSERQIPMLNAHRFGPEYFEADKLHFIPVVHRALGEMLVELVEKDLL
ncbi:MAG: hypothetical protein ABIQ93_03075 [Saprospiraceae bacterium]